MISSLLCFLEIQSVAKGEGPYDVSRGSFVNNCTSGQEVGRKPFVVGDQFVYLCSACARPPCKKCNQMYAETMDYSKPWHDEWTGFCGTCNELKCDPTFLVILGLSL